MSQFSINKISNNSGIRCSYCNSAYVDDLVAFGVLIPYVQCKACHKYTSKIDCSRALESDVKSVINDLMQMALNYEKEKMGNASMRGIVTGQWINRYSAHDINRYVLDEWELERKVDKALYRKIANSLSKVCHTGFDLMCFGIEVKERDDLDNIVRANLSYVLSGRHGFPNIVLNVEYKDDKFYMPDYFYLNGNYYKFSDLDKLVNKGISLYPINITPKELPPYAFFGDNRYEIEENKIRNKMQEIGWTSPGGSDIEEQTGLPSYSEIPMSYWW